MDVGAPGSGQHGSVGIKYHHGIDPRIGPTGLSLSLTSAPGLRLCVFLQDFDCVLTVELLTRFTFGRPALDSTKAPNKEARSKKEANNNSDF